MLEDEPLSRLEEELACIVGEQTRLAFYVGSPGAYRKATALALDPGGGTLAFAKIATTSHNLADIEAERRNLLQLSKGIGLHGRVPKVLGHFRWSTGEVLVMTGGPPKPGPDQLSELHLTFCRDIFTIFSQEYIFAQGPMHSRMSQTLESIRSRLPEGISDLLERGMERLSEELGGVSLPLSLAHRDFAPWNTRIGSRGLFVFDWDRAATATPLYDLFHFQAIQAALLSRKRHLPEQRHLLELLEATWPDGRHYLHALYLAYLLDVSLFYGEARVVAPESGEATVWRWFLARIQRFLDKGSPL